MGIIFWGALSCSILAGLLGSVLAIKNKNADGWNKFERLLVKLHTPTLKILFTLSGFGMGVFSSLGREVSFFSIFDGLVSLSSGFLLAVLCVFLLTEREVLNDKLDILPYLGSPLITNLICLVLFIVTVVLGCIIFHLSTLSVIAYSLIFAIGCMWLMTMIVCLVNGICRGVKDTFRFFVRTIKDYKQWVMKE